MVTNVVGALVDSRIGTGHTGDSDEFCEHVIMSIRLNFVLNTK